ncbi:MAG: AAA family ATPase, partial [Gammaproteobacteria bacterium]
MLREEELEAAAGQHDRAERIVFNSYGTHYGDLASFIRSLRTSTPAGSPATTGPRDASVLPPPPRCFGRDTIIRAVVEQLLLNAPSPIPVLGPPGIGKTTICRAVLHDSSVADRYGIHRYFVRCEKVPTAGALMSTVGSALGLPESSQLRANLMARLHAQRTLLVLDNIEDPWLGDTPAVEELLSAFGSVPTLGLIVSLRGAQRPTGPHWSESVQVPQLPLDQGRKVFLAIAGERYGEDPNLDPLLTHLDGMPLAIKLLAGAAEGEPDLAALSRRWTQERTGLLRRAGAAGQQVSAAASFELSISSPLMTAEARRLLSLLAVVPNGISHDDLPHLESEIGEDAAPTLRKVGLAFDEASRLRTLKPIADYVLAQHPPEQKDQALFSALRDSGSGESVGSITSAPPRTTGEAAAVPGKPGGLAEFYDQWQPLLQKLGQEVLEYIRSQSDPAEPISA